MATQYINSMTSLWNSLGTSYSGIKLNVTNAASSADSKLLELEIGAVDKFTVDKNGNIIAAGTITSAGGTSAGASLPATNDGAALGSATLSWSDLYLASGGVINWANGDVTATHAANTLTFGGAVSGYTFDAAVRPTINDGAPLGTAALSWQDLFLATGGVINWGNNNVTLTHSAGVLTLGTAMDFRLTTSGTQPTSVVTVGGTQTLTGKTLTSPIINGSSDVSPIITGTPTAVGATWASLGTVTTADINGGTIDGTVIGGTAASTVNALAITGTTGAFSSTLSSATTVSAPTGTFATSVTGGKVQTGQHVEATGTNLTLAPAAGLNTINLNPRGIADPVGQVSIDNTGSISTTGSITAAGGTFSLFTTTDPTVTIGPATTSSLVSICRPTTDGSTAVFGGTSNVTLGSYMQLWGSTHTFFGNDIVLGANSVKHYELDWSADTHTFRNKAGTNVLAITAAGALTATSFTGAVTGATTGAHNGTVGATTPAAGSFTTIAASGVITATGGVTGNVTGAVTGATTGAHNGTVGASVPASGSFTTLGASGAANVGGSLTVTGTTTAASFSGPVTGNVSGNTTGAHNGTVGATTPSTGSFTTIAASGLITATGGLNGAHNGTVGATTPAAGSFTTINATGVITAVGGFSGNFSGDIIGDTTGDHNGTVGATTPSTGAFTTVTTSGTLTSTGAIFANGGVIGAVNGTIGATTPANGTFANLTNTGATTLGPNTSASSASILRPVAVADGTMNLYGGSSTSTGSYVQLIGSSHLTLANDIILGANNVSHYQFDWSADTHFLRNKAGTAVATINASGLTNTTINASAIGGTSPSTGAFTTLTTSGLLTASAISGPINGSVGSGSPSTGSFTTLNSTGGALNGSIGGSTPAAGVFTSVNSSGTITGATSGAHNGSVGASTPSSGAFTTITASSTATITGVLTANGGVTGNVTGNTTGAHNGTVGATTPASGAFSTLSTTGAVTTIGPISAASQAVILRPITTGDTIINGGTVSDGGYIKLSGSTHASTANDIVLGWGGVNKAYEFDYSADRHTFTNTVGTNLLSVTTSALNLGSATGNYNVRGASADGSLSIAGGVSGGGIVLYAASHATQPGDIIFNPAALGTVYQYDASASSHIFTGIVDTGTTGQIKFPATPPSSADVNTLDGYTDWIAYTPTITGLGTCTAITMWSKRIGDTLYMRGFFTCGTPTAVEARITLGYKGTNGGISVHATKNTVIQMVGSWGTGQTNGSTQAAANDGAGIMLAEASAGYLTFGIQSDVYDATTKQQGSNLIEATGDVTLNAQIPITGW